MKIDGQEGGQDRTGEQGPGSETSHDHGNDPIGTRTMRSPRREPGYRQPVGLRGS